MRDAANRIDQTPRAQDPAVADAPFDFGIPPLGDRLPGEMNHRVHLVDAVFGWISGKRVPEERLHGGRFSSPGFRLQTPT